MSGGATARQPNGNASFDVRTWRCVRVHLPLTHLGVRTPGTMAVLVLSPVSPSSRSGRPGYRRTYGAECTGAPARDWSDGATTASVAFGQVHA